ncbi:MAG TPA: hypothetical protein VG984_01820 [Candidatus Paceibacterota bacterium]|nr:hypothetical protein [Candidatus Paceibacterota bacterium]
MNPFSISFSYVHRIDRTDFAKSFIATALLFGVFVLAIQAYASTVTLSVVVQTSLTFTSTTDNFTTITPGTPVYATTTLSVLTNDSSGYNVTLSGDNKSTSNNNLQLSGNTSVQITDQTEWVPNAATSSPGNAVAVASFTNSGNVLAFRVMSASSTNGAGFLSTSWWGTADYSSSNSLWAGISSSTVARRIGNAGSGTYSSSAHLNSVQYYLNVSSSQQTGTYNAPITYTATGN